MSDFGSAINSARKLYDEENYTEASKAYYNALNKTTNNSENALVWAELCWTFYKMKSFRQAIEAAESVLEYDPQYAAREDLYRISGYCYLAMDEYDSAESILMKSLEIDNESEKQLYIYYELAKHSFQKQEYKQSEEYLVKVEDFFEKNQPDFWYSLLFFKGFIKYYNKDIESSEAIFAQILLQAKDPITLANGNYGMAYVQFHKKDYLETINICEKVTKLNPQFYDMESLGFLMAASFFYLGRHDIFKKYYDQMQKNFEGGRYVEELKRLYAEIPETDDISNKN